jgi:hypothetical protein
VVAATSDFGALFNAIGQIDRRRFMGAVVAKVRQPGLALVAQPPGVDLLAKRSDGRRIAIEVKTWQRTPPLHLVEAAIDQLARTQRKAGAEEAVLIVRTGLPRTAVEERTAIPPDLHIVPFEDLEHVLRD